MSTRRPTVIELFAGAGIFGSAFKAAGFRLVSAIEIDPTAASTYRRNLGDHIVVSDIRKVTPSGRAEVLIAGPPCQGFSTLGSRNSMDPRNNLSLEVLRWIDKAKPRVIVIENVPQFLASSQAHTLSQRFGELGYAVSSHILCALDYGVPQLRTRAILIGTKAGEVKVAKRKSKLRTVRAAWKGLNAEPDGKNGHDPRPPSELALKRMQLIPTGGDKRDILAQCPKLCPPSWHLTKSEVTDVWGRMHWDEPSNTLRTCFLNPSKGRYIHPEQNRVITIREGARLHSIGDDYIFEGTPYQVARQIGNSVPYNLGRCIADSVRNVLA